MTEDATPAPLTPAPGAGLLRATLGATFVPFLARYPRLHVRTLLEAAAIDPRDLGNPEAWLGVRNCASLLENAAETSNDPAFALSYAERIPWRDLGALAYLVINSPTIGSALANACRYFAVQTTGAVMHLEVDGRDARLLYGIHDPAIAIHEQNTLATFALLIRMCRDGTGDPSWSPREVQFRHRRPARTATQAAFFRCPMTYGRPHDALVLSPDDLRLPLARANAGLLPALVRSANASLPREAFDDRLRGVLALSLRGGEIDLERVASRLGIGVRTLQRRLQTRGKSFQGLVDETRLAQSRRYLADASMPLTEIAFALGYSELSAFSRAFRRWTGQTAIEVRRRAITS